MSYEQAVARANTHLHALSFSQAAVVGAAALIILRRDGYARGTYFAYGGGGGGIGVWRMTQSSSFLWKTDEPSLDDDDRQPRTALLLGLFGEGALSAAIDAAAMDTRLRMPSSSMTCVTNDHHQKMFRHVNGRQLARCIYACAQSPPPWRCRSVDACGCR